jgi:hypothetical protein
MKTSSVGLCLLYASHTLLQPIRSLGSNTPPLFLSQNPIIRHPAETAFANTAAITPPYDTTGILPRHAVSTHIETIRNSSPQDQSEITKLMQFCKNIPFNPDRKAFPDVLAWEVRFDMHYDAATRVFESYTPGEDAKTLLSNQWLTSKLPLLLSAMRPTTKSIDFRLTAMFRDNCGVKPHRDPHYDTGIIAMGAFRKDTHAPLLDPAMNLIIEDTNLQSIPQNPPGGHWAIFLGHYHTHFTQDHPEAQRHYGLPKPELPPYYRLQLVVHVFNPDYD